MLPPAHSPESIAIADEYLAARSIDDPAAAEVLGREVDRVLPDITPAGFAARHEVNVRTVARLTAARTADRLGAVLADRLTDEIDLFDSGFVSSLVAPLATPIHHLRELFDDLPRETTEDWERIAAHLPDAARGYSDYLVTLHDALDRGLPIAARQVATLADQVSSWLAGPTRQRGFYEELAADAPEASRSAVERGAAQASAAAAEFAARMRAEIAPRATGPDRVGRERYSVTARSFLGARLDLDELYAFGWSELSRLTEEATRLGEALTGERTMPAIRAALDARPDGAVPVGPELVEWLQARLDDTAAALDGTHFDLPPRTSVVEARMVTASAGVMYYAPADPNGTRPGRVWWTVPSGVERVPLWREVSTLHHEGLPGHHLQFAITRGLDELHPWQRYLCELHGYAEGWAHYAEGLADELGLVRDDAERINVLDAQAWRAARIVIDLGLHLDLPIPRGQVLTEATRWTPETAAALLATVAGTHPRTAAFEIDRYLAWPGQALSFSVGARIWREARRRAQAARGTSFDLRGFHARALGLGPMGLDLLTRYLEEEDHDE